MPLTTQISTALQRVATEFKTIRAEINTYPFSAYGAQVGSVVTPSFVLSIGAGTALTAQRANFHPIYLMPGTYGAAVIALTTAQNGGSTTLHAAVYPDDGTNSWPLTTANPITSTSATFNLATTGAKTSNFSTPLVVTKPTTYWMCSLYLVTTAPTTTAITAAATNNLQVFARQAATSLTTNIRGYYSTGLTAFPNTARTNSNLTISGSTDVTIVAMQRTA